MNKKCQVFTPNEYVIEMLNIVGYHNNLYGKKIVENACGDGNILCVIVERYIADCKSRRFTNRKIKIGLENDVFGLEIDELHITTCKKRLSEITEKYGISDVDWKILNIDFLKSSLLKKFDYVVGNPPYISYRELDIETRKYLKEVYSSCEKGKFDYYYAFIEASIDCLKTNGEMVYLIPNGVFKNVFAAKLRDIMKRHVQEIYDFTTLKLFENVITSSAIIKLTKNEQKDTIKYVDIIKNDIIELDRDSLVDKWNFSLNQIRSSQTKKFGDFFHVANSVATLRNNIFVLNKFVENNQGISIDGVIFESDIIRKAASPKNFSKNIREYIIFPYKYENNKLVRYKGKEFEEKFPKVKNYLKQFKLELDKRKSDKSCKWFEYGRSQALEHLNQPKLMVSTLITNVIQVHKLDKETIPYSGFYIVTKSDKTLDEAKEILESSDFLEYAQSIGINASGNTLRITSKDIANFIF